MLVSPQPDTSQNDTVDGMVVITFADDETAACFGPSSNSAFFSTINDAVDQMRNVPTRHHGDTLCERQDSTHFSRPVSPNPSSRRNQPLSLAVDDVNCFILPKKETIIELLDRFFTGFGMLFPYIYKKTFLDGIADMESASFRGVRRPWLCLLNTIMAFATSGAVYPHRGQNQTDAEIYLQRALKVLQDISLQSANLEAVQALLLILQYLQGTQQSARTWTLQGLTVHAAFQIGLHSPAENAKYGPLEREIRKRCWHMCCIMDRTCSMTFGRPQSIRQDYQLEELPQDVDFETLGSENRQEQVPSRVNGMSVVAAFVQSIKLYALVGLILQTVYQNNIQTKEILPSSKVFQNIMAIEPQLTAWKAELPSHIRLQTRDTMIEATNPAVSDAPIDITMSLVLTLRFLHTRMLLHRRMLVCFLQNGRSTADTDGEWNFLMNFGKASVEMCLSAALDILDILKSNSPSPTKSPVLTTWWFQIYYAFSAALVIFAVMILSMKHNIRILHLEPQDFLKHIQDASQTITKASSDSRIGNRCRKCLERLLQFASTFQSAGGMQTASDACAFPAASNLADLDFLGNLPFAWDDQFITQGDSIEFF
ncbi:uncharacterized protein A1O5_12915 [Cladophialophora psammophila CBS 110553]|uniref:Xylanolytic transcriptional activator regulatory domain-containing protein n=1 Tax=Cladophialophora psammophila CBS 110553 TaxID=1182543 RepID=W9W8I6_9EURO|nr:uncharacterized protein A1O5_12915 [Cladophialophora psammophila CBS 110553]EXJ54849.1 hypothetical protein A1O5_12915 [Cladophialophora psammophila CBS 110553]